MEARRAFDVICAGQATWKLADGGALRPGGGAVPVAVSLARRGLRVGLATVLPDDAPGRAAVESIAGAGVDVGGVRLARPRGGIVVVDARGGASEAPAEIEAQPPLEVPAGWSSQVLLLAGLSPVVAHAAALCKAARRARRAGTQVVIDFHASLHAWNGRDPRTIRMVLREVDVARCSVADLAVLGMDVATAREALRPGAVLVVSEGAGESVATGPFGEVRVAPPAATGARPRGFGDAFTAALCAELTRRGEPGESASARWDRALRRGHAAALAG